MCFIFLEDLQEKLSELVQQLEEIREKRLEMEAQMAEEDNDLMRVRNLSMTQNMHVFKRSLPSSLRAEHLLAYHYNTYMTVVALCSSRNKQKKTLYKIYYNQVCIVSRV